MTEALHEIKALAHRMREALLLDDLDGFGRLLGRAWREKNPPTLAQPL